MKKEAFWFSVYLIGMALIGLSVDMRAMYFNIGLGMVSWTLGRFLRSKK